jgi:predicted NUDIX family phosphoesterase
MLETQTECVLVVPTSVFHALGHFQGFCPQADRYLSELLLPKHVSYRPRSEMEHDPSYKQLIPYCIFRYRDPDRGPCLFHYRRGKGQGESRLHSKRSIGVGGHISATDRGVASDADPYAQGLKRELEEEIALETHYTQRRVGLINDDQTAVGRVHLGIVHLFDVQQPAISPREPDILESGFQPVAELLRQPAEFETWSQICLTHLFQ